MTTLFHRLAEERKKLGLNQTEFAKYAGVAKTTQFNYEKGIRKPDIEYLMNISAIGVDLDYLLTGERRSSGDPLGNSLLTSFMQAEQGMQEAVAKLLDLDLAKQ